MKKKVKVAQSCLTLCDPIDYTVPGILWTRILEWVSFPLSRGYSQPRDRTPGIEPRSLTLQADSLPAEPQGKPKYLNITPQHHTNAKKKKKKINKDYKWLHVNSLPRWHSGEESDCQ